MPGRWPSAGPTAPFGTGRSYRQTVRQMLDTGTLLDAGMIYFDARLHTGVPAACRP
jgi:carboxylate-amine ligase